MTNKSKKILSEISAGELLDKISILEIKLEKIQNEDDLIEINKEYKALKDSEKMNINSTDKVNQLFSQIKEINLKLWNIEDQIRNCESKKDFSQTFIDLARDVYINNDKRSKIKSEINKTLGSNIREIKKYSNY